VRLFRDLLIRRKLILIMTLSSCVTLFVACVAWLTFDWSTYRHALTQEVSAVAEVVGRSSASAIDFADQAAMQSALDALTEHQHVRRAVLFAPDGTVLASYCATGGNEPPDPLIYQRDGTRLAGGFLVVYRPIEVTGGDEIGTIAVEADFGGLKERQIEFVQVVFLVLLMCVLLAFGMAYKLQGVISVPLGFLTTTMRAVSERKDYTLRARKHGQDEIGFLTDAFNEMLGTIQDRDAELERHRNTLEEEVAHRTLELTETNEQLRKSMQEAQAAAVAKAQFLANVSHEIRTPMNGILGMNELLLDSQLDPQQRNYAEIVGRSAESLLELINDILDFSKIEAGKLRLESIQFDLVKVVEEVVGLLSSPARKKGLEVVCWIAPEIPPVVRGDPTRLRQVLTNLVGNSVKFTERGRIGVRVELLGSSEEAVRMRFSVEDTGVGIAAADLSRLFLSFGQLDASTTRKYGGTGLGLAISKQLVELMGGEIAVASEVGRGSTFSFTIELQRSANDRRSLLLPAGFALPRLLVADRSSAVREVLHQQLLAWSCAHRLAEDKAKIRSLLHQAAETGEPVELCLLDQDYLAREGDLVADLRCAVARGTKVVLLSWTGAKDEAPVELEVHGRLFKPIRPSQLFNLLLSFSMPGAAQEAAHEPAPAKAPDSRLRVLVAEDNQINQLVASRILAKGGHAHEIVADGVKACEAVQRGGFDVVLMDCQMPVIDGFEATRRIREWERTTGTAPIHIIALTANALNTDRDRCLQVGMDDYVPKPVKPEVLLERLSLFASARHRSAPSGGRAAVEFLARVRGSLQAQDSQAALRSATELVEHLSPLSSEHAVGRARELLRLLGEGRLDAALAALEELGRVLGAAPAAPTAGSGA
jgi:signal transduction histidine kinase/CheY-like chemotaxis protein